MSVFEHVNTRGYILNIVACSDRELINNCNAVNAAKILGE